MPVLRPQDNTVGKPDFRSQRPFGQFLNGSGPDTVLVVKRFAPDRDAVSLVKVILDDARKTGPLRGASSCCRMVFLGIIIVQDNRKRFDRFNSCNNVYEGPIVPVIVRLFRGRSCSSHIPKRSLPGRSRCSRRYSCPNYCPCCCPSHSQHANSRLGHR